MLNKAPNSIISHVEYSLFYAIKLHSHTNSSDISEPSNFLFCL